MQKLFTPSFFRFVLGFATILGISFAITFAADHYAVLENEQAAQQHATTGQE